MSRQKCITKYCRNQVTTGHGKSARCSKCRTREFKERYPFKHMFNKRRQGAKRRGIAFELTLEELTRWSIETGYADSRGRAASDKSIDRIDHTKGYRLDNIRCITVSENSTKSNLDGSHGKHTRRDPDNEPF